MNKIKKPNVLVAGFPKCGSTYLYHLLKQHPDIFIPKIKEINYFNKDNFFLSYPEILNPRYFKSLKWYYGFFDTDKKIVIDFSILSALDVGSAKRVKDLLGDIKILFIVKNKEKFLESLKKHTLSEDGNVSLQKQYSNFEYYINFYKNIFSRVHVINLEDLNKNPNEEMKRIVSFLKIKEHNFNMRVPRYENKDYQMNFLQKIKRKVYIKVLTFLYKLISLTVTAKIKAQGEN